MAPIYNGLALALLLACFLPAVALAQDEDLAAGTSASYPHFFVGEKGKLRVHGVANSEPGAGNTFSFIHNDQNRGRLETAVIARVTPELGTSGDVCGILAYSCHVHASEERLGTVSSFGDFLDEMRSTQASALEGNVVDCGPVPPVRTREASSRYRNSGGVLKNLWIG